MTDILGTINGETLDGTSDPDTIHADGGDDIVNGLGGDDQLYGEGGNDTLNGGDGADALRGGPGNDLLHGDAGDDFLVGAGGNDLLDGGAGEDRITLFDGSGTFGVTVDLRLENVAQDFGPFGLDTLVSIEQVLATYGNDTLIGNDDRNFFWSAGGFDNLSGNGGDDYFTVGDQDKVIDGGDGNDTVEIDDTDSHTPIYSTAGVNVSLLLQGQSQAVGTGNWTLTNIENLSGSFGNDTFTGDGNANILAGAGGNDTLNGGGGDDTLMGDGAIGIGFDLTNPNSFSFIDSFDPSFFLPGDDLLNGGAGNDTLYGGGGNDRLRGNADNDVLYGGAGDDNLVGGPGNDLLDGGDGDDVANLFDGTGTFGITVDLRLDGIAQDLGPLGVDTLVSIEQVWSTYGNDNLTGNEAGNWFWTYGGNDTLSGNGGDDYFTVGDQDKVVDGGSGSDTLEFDDSDANAPLYTAGGVNVSLALQGQTQSVGTGNWTISNIENLSGNWGNDTFTGDDNANTLAGAGGSDTLDGGAGDDVLMGDGAMVYGYDPTHPNRFEFQADISTFPGMVEGSDTLLGGEGNDTLYGGGGDDYLEGNNGNDYLDGGTGSDTMVGGAGDDIYIVDKNWDGVSSDVVVESPDEGTDEVRSYVDFGIGGMEVENLTALGSGNVFVGGNDYDNVLTGNDGDNYFEAAGGNDTVNGGSGNDIASFQLPVGTPGMPTIVDGTGEDAGKLLVNLVDGDNSQTYLKIAQVDGVVTVEGVGLGASFGTDTLTGIEQIHTFVRTADDSPATQFVAINLAAQQYGDFVAGSEFNETLDLVSFAGAINANAGRGDDALTGTDDANSLQGGEGADIINGLGGDDYIEGNEGNDVIDGGTGADTMVGGAGDDVYYFDHAWDGSNTDNAIENSDEGTDEVRTTVDLGIDWMPNVENLTALGTGNLFLGGSAGANVLTGNDGDNVLRGEGGDDTLIGGGGTDSALYALPSGTVGTLRWIEGADADAGKLLVQLVDGSDVQTWAVVTITGEGSATVTGVGLGASIGTDILTSVEQLNFFVDGTSDPAQQIGLGLAPIQYGDFVSGGEGSDTIQLGDFASPTGVNGNGGDDTIVGTAADEYLIGGGGSDTIDGVSGNDTAAFHLPEGTVGSLQQVAGTGADAGSILIQLVNGSDVQTVFKVTVTSAGNATVEGLGLAAFLGTDTVTNVDHLDLMIANSSGSVPPEQFTSVQLTAAQYGNFVSGGVAGDTIDLADFPGATSAEGNGGNDTILGTAASENIGGGAGNDTLHGGDGNDTLRGAGGNDSLYGEVGDDFLVGGAGNDLLDGGAGADRVSLFDGSGSFGITVDLRIEGTAQDLGPFGMDTLVSIEHVTATYGNDTLTGNESGNWFWTFGGNDVVSGNGGDDYFTVGDQDKVVDGGEGSDTLEFDDSDAFIPLYSAAGINVSLLQQGVSQAVGTGNWTITGIENLSGNYGNDTLTGDANDNTLAGAGGDDTLTGGDGNDTLLGDGGIVFGYDSANPGSYKFFADLSQFGAVSGNDTLDGGAGADVLDGGVGDDVLTGGADGDTFRIGLGHDTVTDFELGIDKVDVSVAHFTSFAQLQPYLSQSGGDVVFSLLFDGVINTLTLQNVDLATLGEGDFIFASATDPVTNDGTDNADTLFGGSNADQLDGRGGDDQIFGYEGNDTVHGGDGNDTLDGGTGTNSLYGDAGDDLLIANGPLLSNMDVLDGGDGNDTLELRVAAVNPPALTTMILPIVGIEQINFASQVGNGILAVTGLDRVAPLSGTPWSALSQLIGGAGADLMLFNVNPGGGTFTMPDLVLTNWSGNDQLLLSAGSLSGNYTLNAREGLASIQNLIGGLGNDTLNGSSGTDVLNGDGGVNVLNGGGGDDTLTIQNGVPFVGGAATSYTGAGSLYDGGEGQDRLSIGGSVSFAGVIANIEEINLQPAVGVAGTAGSQGAAYLEMDLAHFAMLPDDFTVSGVGVIDPDINQGESFDFSGVQFAPDSDVTFYFDGESDDPGPAVTWVGTSHGDYFNFGSDIITATGGGGADIFQVGGTNATVVDFTIGEDKLDLTEEGVDTAARLLDFVSQVGNDVVIDARDGDDDPIHFVLQNTQLADLSESDVIFAAPGGAQNETGSALGDIMFGYGDNDVFHGGEGDDRIYGGGGTDALYGDGGDDTIVLDGLITGGTYDGGAGNDTLEVRTTDTNAYGAYGSSSSYTLYSASLSGIETIRFGSEADTAVSAQVTIGQVVGSGLTTLIGGEGRDSLIVLATSLSGGTFTMPALTLQNWVSSATPVTEAGDGLILVAAGQGDFTLNAREGLPTIQALIGGAGNDVLNGSSGTDVLDGAGGANVLNANDGDDILVIANLINPQGQLTAFTGAGSTFDGGDGFDTLFVGGAVNFEGSLANIEAIYLQPAFSTPLPMGVGSQADTSFRFDGSVLVSLPANLALSGTGTITIDLGADSHYDATGWAIADGSSITVNVVGSDGDDTLVLGSFAERVTGGAGTDTAIFAGDSTDYAVSSDAGNLTVGNDTLVSVELLQFNDGIFFWNGSSLVSAVNEGLVADGYVAGATVYIDVNNNGVMDSGEPSTITDANGDFTLVSPYIAPLRAFGGTNIDTGLPNTIQFSATEGSTVINPLTTLVQTMVESGQATDAAAAQTAVKSAFGIDAGIDLANVDLIQAATDDPSLALTAHQAATSVAAVLSVVNNVGGDSQAALTQLTTIVAGGGSVDLTNSATLTQVVDSGLAGSTVSSTDVVTVVQGSTTAISSATSVSEVTAAQQNAAPSAVADSGAVAEDATVSVGTRATGLLGNDSDPDAGETGLLRVSKVIGADPLSVNVAKSGSTTIAGTYGTLHVAADGTYSYSADLAAADALAAGATANEVFTYKIVDPSGQLASATLTFTVTGVDDPAIARDDTLTTTEDTVSTGSLFADHGSDADSDIDGTLSIAAVNGDAGSVGSQITLASGALLTVNANGSYDYDPNGAFDDLAQFGSGASNQSTTDSFTYTLADGNTATVTVDLHGVASVGDRMVGSAGSDTLTGTSTDDMFMLQDGSSDSASGGDGNDGFYMGAELDYDDHLDGGDGIHDQVGLQGFDYGSTVELHELGPDNFINVEQLVLLSGSDTRFGDPGTNFYSYYLQENDANVAAGQQFAVSWNNLRAGEDVTFDGSAENDGSFITYAGHGIDTVIGGQQNDSFFFGYGMWGASDSVDGQAGALDELGLQGDYTAAGAGPIVFGAGQLTSVELLVCISGGDARFGAADGSGYSYDLTMNDGNVAAGETLYISANKLMAADGGLLLTDETLTFDGSHESDGNFVIYSGFGADHIVGGGGDDTIYGGGGADTLSGGAGNDTFAYIAAGHSTASAMDHITDFASGDRIDLSGIDAIAGGDNDGFAFIADSAFSHAAGELRAFEQSPGQWQVEGDVDGDGVADLVIALTSDHALSGADFVL